MTQSGTWYPAAIGLGGNVDDVLSAFARALEGLDADDDIRVRAVSSAWSTAPWGLLDQPDFVNAVVVVESRYDSMTLLRRLQAEENRAGRERVGRWGPRRLDLDLLWYADEIRRDPELELPHPLIAERSFVLEPALEVAPDWKHPATGESLWDMRARLADSAGWTRCDKMTEGTNACRS